MTLDAGTRLGPGAGLPLSQPALQPRRALRGEPEEALARLHAYFLEGCPDEVRSVLETVLVDARKIRDGFGDDDIGDGLASIWYAASAMVELAAALELDGRRPRGRRVAEACALPAARFALFSQTVASARSSTPPVVAVEIQLNLLLAFDVLDVRLSAPPAASPMCRSTPPPAAACERRPAARQRRAPPGGSQVRPCRSCGTASPMR
jgi:hypothetical protein